nr:MAG TPA: hypothetical protein [Caudoviricetes sp.]
MKSKNRYLRPEYSPKNRLLKLSIVTPSPK